MATVDEDAPVRMTMQEIALVREIVRWRRHHGVEYYLWPQSLGRYDEWKRHVGGKRITVARDSGGVHATRDYFNRGDDGRLFDLPSASVTETVDFLVALGFLPQRFSSAYAAGWHAASVWGDTSQQYSDEEFARLFHDPDNISFPAMEVRQ